MPESPSGAARRARRWLAGLCAAALLLAASQEIGLRVMGFAPLPEASERARFWAPHPRLGWHHRPGQRGVFETPRFRVEVAINSLGLRDREPARVPAFVRARVLVLGDSFAWGYGVEQRDAFPDVLESMWPGVDVVNAGVSGYSTDQELLWMREAAAPLRPDLVVLQLCANDDAGNREKLAYFRYPKPRFTLEGGRLVAHPPEPPRVRDRLAAALLGRSALAFQLFLAFGPQVSDRPLESRAEAAREFALTRHLVAAVAAHSRALGARFALLAVDADWRSQRGTFADLLAALRADGLAPIEVEGAPGWDPGRMRIPHDIHWNAAGHRFAAARLAAAARARGLLPPDARPARGGG